MKQQSTHHLVASVGQIHDQIRPSARPMLLGPWSWTSRSPTQSKSPPRTALPSSERNRDGSIARPQMDHCVSHAFRMRIRPPSSRISASMIPGRSLKPATSLWPLMTASTASRLHSGQSDRVRLGTPVPIGVRWCFFRSRPGAQLGAGSAPSWQNALTELAMVQCCAGCETRVRGHTLEHEIYLLSRFAQG